MVICEPLISKNVCIMPKSNHTILNTQNLSICDGIWPLWKRCQKCGRTSECKNEYPLFYGAQWTCNCTLRVHISAPWGKEDMFLCPRVKRIKSYFTNRIYSPISNLIRQKYLEVKVFQHEMEKYQVISKPG